MVRGKENIAFNPLELDGSHRTAGIITILIGGRTINYVVQQWKQDVRQHEQCEYQSLGCFSCLFH